MYDTIEIKITMTTAMPTTVKTGKTGQKLRGMRVHVGRACVCACACVVCLLYLVVEFGLQAQKITYSRMCVYIIANVNII